MTDVIEFRRYTLRPGQRDVLIDLFDREFVESQEALGARVLGQFRDLGDPDRFVWLRGFTGMATRPKCLTAFYTGPVWRANSAAANATMIDVDDVFLLRPVSGFTVDPAVRDTPVTSLVVATAYFLDEPAGEPFVRRFESDIVPLLDGKPLAYLSTEYAENNFPSLPIRTGEHVLVWFASVADLAAAHRLDELPALARQERLILEPTARSLVR